MDVICHGEDEVLVPAFCHKLLEERVHGDVFGVILLAQEYHRAGISEGLVMVLCGILEYLLERTGAARGIDDATLRDGEDAVFAYAVVEVFGDVCRERRCRLVTVEPCRDAEAVILFLRVFLYDLECQ